MSLDIVPNAVNFAGSIIDKFRQQDDNEKLSRIAIDANTNPDAVLQSLQKETWNNPASPKLALEMVDSGYKKQAVPMLASLAKDYEQVTGTLDPRFMADPQSREELAKAGLTIPKTNNPYVAQGIDSFINRGRASEMIANETGGNRNLAGLVDLYGEKGLSEVFGRAKQNEEMAAKQQETAAKNKQLSDFALASKYANENLGFLGNGDQKGDYLSAPEIRQMTANDLSKFQLTNEQRDVINRDMDKALSDRFITSQRNTPKGLLTETVNPYTGAVKDQVAGTTFAPKIEVKVGANGLKPKALTPNAISDLSDFKNLVSNLKDMQGITGVDTGPISGRAQNIASKFGAASEPFVKTQQKEATVNNIMLKLRSGAAVTEQEYERFKKEMPLVTDAPETRKIKLNNAINYMTNLQNSKIQAYDEGGYVVPPSVYISQGESQQAPSRQQQTSNKAQPVSTGKVGKYSFSVR